MHFLKLPIDILFIAPENHAPQEHGPQKAPPHPVPAGESSEKSIKAEGHEKDPHNRLHEISKESIRTIHIQGPGPEPDAPHIYHEIKRQEAKRRKTRGENGIGGRHIILVHGRLVKMQQIPNPAEHNA